jgi:hypothetical protein
MGPAFGIRPQSYRAEGYGMLAFLRFLIRIAEFTGKTEPWTGIIGTDSQSVLDTIAGKAPYGEHPNRFHEQIRIPGDPVFLDSLSADWDILIEIQYALKLLPGISLQYVKGHQDSHTLTARLPLMAQLNVEADAKAATYQDMYGAERTSVCMTSRTRAHLHFKCGTVTSRYQAAIRREYSGDALLQHIKTRNKWTDATVMTVNWESHGAALSKHINPRRHFSKLVHDILPTLAFLNKQDNGKRLCPCCRHPQETRDHILRCPAPMRNKWRHSFLTSLDTFCLKTPTAPPLRTLLLEAVRAWLYHGTDEAYTPDISHYPTSLRSLIMQQNAIGWRQLFNGRFSVQWSIIQDEYLYRTRADRGNPSEN